jgi:transcriptional antiterminator NusG
VGSSVTENGSVKWYIIHTYVGHEEKVKNKLLQRVKSMDAGNKILAVEIPKENEKPMRHFFKDDSRHTISYE